MKEKKYYKVEGITDMHMSLFSAPLTEVSRKSRRNLLAASAIAFAIAFMGLIPTKMESLGIEFSQTNQHSFLIMVLFLLLYFGTSFSIDAGMDFSIWHINLKRESETIKAEASKSLVRDAAFRRGMPVNETATEEYQRHIDRQVQKEVDISVMGVSSKYKFLGYLRIAWDVFMPILVGVSAIIALIAKLNR
ncbi:MAG: hypothetical protein ACYC7L_04270 [Nitrospirota bacterium]